MKTNLPFPFAVFAFWWIVATGPAPAQSFTVNPIVPGGGSSTGGVFVLSGTVGQPEASSAPGSGGGFSLSGGFWPIFLVQTPGAPVLGMERLGASARLFWPLPASGFVLEQSLSVTGAWSQVAFPYLTNATCISVQTPMPAGNQFFRLRKP